MREKYESAQVERAMKVQEVLLKAIGKEMSWIRAAEILGLSARTVRRYRWRLKEIGYDGLFDRRSQPSPKKVPTEQVEKLLELYRKRYSGFNVRHFYGIACREHEVKLSYSYVRQALQVAGLVKKRRSRGRHRLRREPRACFGEMLHIDGSPHEWLKLEPGERQTLIAILDDATGRILYAQLEASETSHAVMTAMRTVIEEHGIPMAFYTDRAGWAFFTPKQGQAVDKKKLTQVGRALARLGVEHIPAYSPQARGRSERLNRTLQDRLVNELRVAKIKTIEAANRYLREKFIPLHNQEFSRVPQDPQNVFVPIGTANLDSIFCHEEERTVGKDNTVVLDGIRLQIPKQPGRKSCEHLRVLIRRHLDGTHTVCWGSRLLGAFDKRGRPLDPSLPANSKSHSRAA